MNDPIATARPTAHRQVRAGPLRHLLFAVFVALAPCVNAAVSGADNHLQVELVSARLALVPGQTAQLGLRLRHDAHWHTYWINPGDSGLPTTLAWTLPPGFHAQDIAWPLPQRFTVGGLYNFGYDGEVVLPVPLDVPADVQPGTTAHLAVLAKWLVCREECIPGKAELTLDLPITTAPAQPDPRWTHQFTDAERAQPQASAWTGTARLAGERIEIALRGPGLPEADRLDAFVAQRKLFDNKPPAIRRDGDALLIDAGRSEYFSIAPALRDLDLVLTAPTATGMRGWRVRVRLVTPIATPAQP
ncbi:protein-disulfide reductase DsbD domain-containing protein [Dokdonella soli]|uniref:Thiol:disulfide interchange protein DsbD N-terminal domain-containing protein n=1 Tax=Dokdonella soli TaxID=529810 RepID=A0ABP3TKT7_9GAMM